MLNLDTHILIHALSGDLTAGEAHQLADEPWGISAIVLWEVARLRQLGRIESAELDFNSDPADELIAATSIVHRALLVTRDRKIRASKLVPIAR
jgi:PIN domain nuclease of toxin-antitoxin system